MGWSEFEPFLRSRGCAAPGVRSAPRRCCRPCRRAGRGPPPAAAPRTPCVGTAPGTEASQSDPEAYRGGGDTTATTGHDATP